VPWTDTTETLLYDFSLSIGDTLTSTYNYGDNNTILDIDSVLVGSNYHKRFLLGQMGWNGNTTPDTTYAIIEGVGSTTGFLGMIVRPFENFTTLECFTHDTQQYPSGVICPINVGMEEQQGKPMFSVYPNPMSDKLTVMLPKFSKDAVRIELLDLSGRIILTENTSQPQMVVNVAGLPVGMYWVRVTTPSLGTYNTKILKL
jgi:Secretion system C-terminal sorting domain